MRTSTTVSWAAARFDDSRDTGGPRGAESPDGVVESGTALLPSLYACAALNLLALLPILLFVPRYIDDNGRATGGYAGWNAGGRPLSDWLMLRLDGGEPLALATPLFQVLAVAILACCGVIVGRLFRIRSAFWTAVVALPLAAQPYFLENMSYGFDAATMSAGLLLAVGATAVMAAHGPVWLRVPVAAATLVASFSFYQPAAVAFLPLCLFVFSTRLFEDDGALSQYLWQVVAVLGAFGIALIAYRYLVLASSELAAYTSQNASTVPLGTNLVRQVLGNVRAYWTYLLDDWRGTQVGRVAGATVAMALGAVAIAAWRIGTAAIPRVLAVVAVLGTTALFVHGPSLLLQDPFLQPRTFVSLGALLTGGGALLLTLASQDLHRWWRPAFLWMSRGVLVFGAWALIVVSYSYAAAFRSQTEFEQAFLTRVAYDIEHHRAELDEEGVKTITFVGKMPVSRILSNSVNKLPYLGQPVPRLIANNWWWGHIVVNNYVVGDYLSHSDLSLTPTQSTELRATGQARELFASSAYRGFVYDHTLVVELPWSE